MHGGRPIPFSRSNASDSHLSVQTFGHKAIASALSRGEYQTNRSISIESSVMLVLSKGIDA